MKYYFILIPLILLLSIGCSSQKNTNNKTQTILNQNPLNIYYNAKTRGQLKRIHIINNSITYTTLKEKKHIVLSSKTKNELTEIINNLNLEKLKFLKSPTNKRMFDGAMHTFIKITKDNTAYTSANFDHGHPPETLSPLVNLIMTLIK